MMGERNDLTSRLIVEEVDFQISGDPTLGGSGGNGDPPHGFA